MKKTISFLVLIVCLFASANVFSRSLNEKKEGDDEPKRTHFQLRGAVNFASVRINIDGSSRTEKVKVGYQFAVIADITLGRDFYFQPGLSLVAKGSKLREMPIGNSGVADLSMNAVYLQVPMYFAYKQKVGKWNNYWGVAFGPYVACGIAGRITGPHGVDVDTFGDTGLANRPDVGIGVELQFELPKLLFFYGTELGITKMMKSEYFTKPVRSSNLYLGVGYKF